MRRSLRYSHRALSLLWAVLTVCAWAQPSEPMRLDDAYGDSFVNYQPYVGKSKKTEPTKKPPQTAESSPRQQPPPAKPQTGEQKVDVDWLRKNYAKLETDAINDPSDKNMAAFLYTKRIVVDKAQRYAEAYMRETVEDPLLNENNRIPYASMGAQHIRNADYRAQQEAARELARIGGSVLFVDSNCRFCAMQIPILQAIKNNFGLEFLVVSMDGAAPSNYKGRVVADNGLFTKLGLKLTPSLVFVPRPKSYQGEMDPNVYLIISQGFYTQDEMVKQLAFAGHNRGLLSERTMADLDVWDRGVLATEDLDHLTLDASRPETFKQKLQPILMKQYR